MQTLFVNYNDTRLIHDDTKLNLSIDADNGTTQSKTSTNLAGSVTAKDLIQRGESSRSFFGLFVVLKFRSRIFRLRGGVTMAGEGLKVYFLTSNSRFEWLFFLNNAKNGFNKEKIR